MRLAVSRRRLLIAAAGALGATAVAKLAAGAWIPVKAELAQRLLERAWIEVQAGRPGTRPWPWADTSPVARLSVPSLGISWIVLSGASGRNLAFAPAHMDGSPAPGERGVSIIAGHRDTHFRALWRLEPGARLELEAPGGAVQGYEVSRVEVVDARDARLRLDAGAPWLVLVTCYPFDAPTAGGPLRYLVTAQSVGAGRRRMTRG